MPEVTLQQAFDLAVQYHQAGQLNEAESLYRQILAVEPRHAESLHHLGLIAHQVGRNDLVVDLIRQAHALRPDYPEALNNLGNALKDRGQLDEATAAYRQAIALRHDYPEAYSNLGIALAGKGQFDEAIAAYGQTIALNPGYPEAYNNLGNALGDKGQLDEAIAAYHQAIAVQPDYAEAYCNLGVAMAGKGQPDDAIAAYRQAIALQPDYPEAYCNLGGALKDEGQLDEAIIAYRQALAMKPDYFDAHGNLVFVMICHPGFDASAIAEEHRRWNQLHAEPLRSFIEPHGNDRSPSRRLRIGYVSPDFRAHAVGYNILPLLTHHKPQEFEIFCYAGVARPDVLTERFRACASHWRSTVGFTDEQLVATIREDRIDILVDLSLHTANNRLRVFARKPAPVQVTFAGYPGITGLTAIDYRLSDPYLDPPGMDESIYSEHTVRLPRSWWCYDPFDCNDIPVSSLPALSNGFVTFGCLNNFCKVSDSVLRLWAGALRAVPDSRLLLMAPEGGHRQHILDLLEQEDIASERIGFVTEQPRRKYLELYHRIDLGLDTLPYNGHTTSLDSLWMGVPVVTLVGQTVVGRAGLCQLMNLGHPELIAQTSEEFVRIAAELAGDIPRLMQLRSTLRERMEQSPLMDAAGFAHDIEAAYRTMWRTWCEQPESPSCPQ
jgi:predicted O-linked N-acetylglucosamine transferase (SPINDLY family)